MMMMSSASSRSVKASDGLPKVDQAQRLLERLPLMTTKINGAQIEEQRYEFGYERQGEVTPVVSYEVAKRLADDGKLKMRCIYTTEWMPAK